MDSEAQPRRRRTVTYCPLSMGLMAQYWAGSRVERRCITHRLCQLRLAWALMDQAFSLPQPLAWLVSPVNEFQSLLSLPLTA